MFLSRVDSICLSSVIPGLKGLGRGSGLVPWTLLELSFRPVPTVDIEMWLEPGVARLDVGLRI